MRAATSAGSGVDFPKKLEAGDVGSAVGCGVWLAALDGCEVDAAVAPHPASRPAKKSVAIALTHRLQP